MWPFKKKKVIDLTSSKIPSLKTRKDVSGYKDLTSDANQESALGFLGNLATASSESISEIAPELSLKHLKVKIEDIEYKINSLRSRLDKVLDRLDLAEKKIDRQGRL